MIIKGFFLNRIILVEIFLRFEQKAFPDSSIFIVASLVNFFMMKIDESNL